MVPQGSPPRPARRRGCPRWKRAHLPAPKPTEDIVTTTKRPKIKLNDTQRVILSTAAKAKRPIGRDDLNPRKAKGAALTRAISGFLKRGLIEEVRVQSRARLWRKDEAGNAAALAITTTGQEAIGLVPERKMDKGAVAPVSGHLGLARPSSKQAQLIDMLQADESTIADLGETLGWLPHTVGAALTRLRQQGLAIERVREDGASRYRIATGRRAA